MTKVFFIILALLVAIAIITVAVTYTIYFINEIKYKQRIDYHLQLARINITKELCEQKITRDAWVVAMSFLDTARDYPQMTPVERKECIANLEYMIKKAQVEY